jgi:hypothetical protein
VFTGFGMMRSRSTEVIKVIAKFWTTQTARLLKLTDKNDPFEKLSL